MTKNGKSRSQLKHRLIEFREVYIMIIPVIVFFLVFKYYPMYGIVISFKDYYPSLGISGSPFVGVEHFKTIFIAPQFLRSLRNTLVLSSLKLIFCFPVPILWALFLNEMRQKKVRGTVQTLIYLPNFISWVIIGEIVRILLSTGDGLVNNVISSLGGEKVPFLTTPEYFYPIYILSTIWKEAGWGSIIYFASMTGVNPDLYEAAKLDGAGRLKMVLHVTLPCISPTIIMMLIMQIANIMNAGFDPIFNLYNKSVYSVADILDTYMYRAGIIEGKIEMGAALGLFKSAINFVMLITADAVIRKINGRGIYD